VTRVVLLLFGNPRSDPVCKLGHLPSFTGRRLALRFLRGHIFVFQGRDHILQYPPDAGIGLRFLEEVEEIQCSASACVLSWQSKQYFSKRAGAAPDDAPPSSAKHKIPMSRYRSIVVGRQCINFAEAEKSFRILGVPVACPARVL